MASHIELAEAENDGALNSVTQWNLAVLARVAAHTHAVFASRAQLEAYEAALAAAAQLSEAAQRLEHHDAHDAEALAQVDAALAHFLTITQRTANAQPIAIDLSEEESSPQEELARAQVARDSALGQLRARFSEGWVAVTALTVIVGLLERARRYGDAVRVLRVLLSSRECPQRRGDWWQRLVVNLEHLQQRAQALDALERALADTQLAPHARLALEERLQRLWKPPLRYRTLPAVARALSAALREPRHTSIRGTALRGAEGARVGKAVYIGYDGARVSVEELALQHYARSERWQGVHSEGSVWHALFGLLHWALLYDATVPGAFFGPYHSAPLDLALDDAVFYRARASALEALWTQLSRESGDALAARVEAAWHAHVDTRSVVPWNALSLTALCEIVRCMPPPGLVAICRELAHDFAHAHAGMPDLVLWRWSGNDGALRLVEVKSARDRLSDKQRWWLHVLCSSGVDCEVLHVLEEGQQLAHVTPRREADEDEEDQGERDDEVVCLGANELLR